MAVAETAKQITEDVVGDERSTGRGEDARVCQSGLVFGAVDEAEGPAG